VFLLSVDIIFPELSIASSVIACCLKLIFRNVFYMKLSGQNKSKLAISLKRIGILPLPIADLEKIFSFADADSDPNGYAWSWIDQKLGKIDFGVLERSFLNIKNLDQKIRLYLLDFVALKLTSIGSKLIFWNENYPQKKIIFISFSWEDYAIPKFPDNCFKIILPVPNLFSLVPIFSIVLKKFIIKLLVLFRIHNVNSVVPDTNIKFEWGNFKHGYVTHAGLSYAALYNKSLYYSDSNPFFYPNSLVHFDYSGLDSPSSDLPWWRLTPAKKLNIIDVLLVFRDVLSSLKGSIFTHAYLLVFFRVVVLNLKFHAHQKDLLKFNNLKIVYIDYDMLCPKSLLMAFESSEIKTLATQERFVFLFYKTATVFLSHYLVPSSYSKEVIQQSRNFLIDNLIPLGQYRSDEFFHEFPNSSMNEFSKNFKKNILVLGHHCDMDWEDSQSNPILNWKAQVHFLDDILSLAKEFVDSLFILRYKTINWLDLEFFTQIKERLFECKNILISEEYSISFYSYYLVQKADFIIGKQTSLMDEALSIGKPVLMHDYTHNIKSIIGDTFDYFGSRILCQNFPDFKERISILIEDDDALKSEVLEVGNKLYGKFSDGNVKQRIHQEIQGIFTSLTF
jgi:hypothetical protein